MNGDILELIKLAQDGDEKAVEAIIEENSGLIWSVVRRFLNRGCDLEDLYQIGSIGLLKCIKNFDTNYDVKFSTYAVPMIMGEIKRFLRDDGIIKISRSLKETATKAKYMKDVLTKKNNEEPTISELAIAIDVPLEDLVLALDADRDVESLYSTVYQNDGKSVYLIDKLELKNDNQDNIVESIVLKDIIKNLEPREREIINLRYFEDKTQSQVAKIIGVSQVQVSRIEKKVLAKIREKFG
ncbi:RNA polymerase sporulation sigma factor SigF [uncultured Tyzzerella sp.]|uniref:RNA polymerase sporulation sigma factor SigF n=1 Tax=uncultured Tyzzerella sp. TaxID=2321398 RepID=UPI0029427223|nr:RNA polymerase sporulation sigma factor SigF [uncultured Tyzzerella sp.]